MPPSLPMRPTLAGGNIAPRGNSVCWRCGKSIFATSHPPPSPETDNSTTAAPRRSAGLGLGLGFWNLFGQIPSQDVKQLHHSTAIIPRFTPSSLGVKQLHHSTVHDRVLLLHLSRCRQSRRNEGSTTFTTSATDAPRKALQC